jgi:hypothetical protein
MDSCRKYRGISDAKGRRFELKAAAELLPTHLDYLAHWLAYTAVARLLGTHIRNHCTVAR